MKKSPTLLMKELKAIQTEIARVHVTDERDSSVPLNDNYEPRYASSYSYEENRNMVKELQKREMAIHTALNVFNMNTKIDGYDLTVSEALVKIAQLRSEIKVLTPMVSHQETFMTDYSSRYGRSDEIRKSCYDLDKAKEDLRVLQQELAALQVAVDRVNLNSVIEC